MLYMVELKIYWCCISPMKYTISRSISNKYIKSQLFEKLLDKLEMYDIHLPT